MRPRAIDETRLGQEAGIALVGRLALAKARAVAASHPEAFVIGSDQAATCRMAPAEKSSSANRGRKRVASNNCAAAPGRTLAFLTAVAVVRDRDGCAIEFVDTTRVTFRVLDEAAIERYVAREAPVDCAGGFKSEGLGISLCESIDSEDPSALIGLPLIRLCAVLRRVGYQIP